MKYLLIIITLFTACSKSNEVKMEAQEKTTYTFQIEAVDIDGQVTTSEALNIKF